MAFTEPLLLLGAAGTRSEIGLSNFRLQTINCTKPKQIIGTNIHKLVGLKFITYYAKNLYRQSPKVLFP